MKQMYVNLIDETNGDEDKLFTLIDELRLVNIGLLRFKKMILDALKERQPDFYEKYKLLLK